MNFTTTTEIARKGSKIFENLTYVTVLNNNTDIGMLIGKELYKKVLETGILDDLLEDIEMEKNAEKLRKKYTHSLQSGVSDLVI